jgi:hypothetical protein
MLYATRCAFPGTSKSARSRLVCELRLGMGGNAVISSSEFCLDSFFFSSSLLSTSSRSWKSSKELSPVSSSPRGRRRGTGVGMLKRFDRDDGFFVFSSDLPRMPPFSTSSLGRRCSSWSPATELPRARRTNGRSVARQAAMIHTPGSTTVQITSGLKASCGSMRLRRYLRRMNEAMQPLETYCQLG